MGCSSSASISDVNDGNNNKEKNIIQNVCKTDDENKPLNDVNNIKNSIKSDINNTKKETINDVNNIKNNIKSDINNTKKDISENVQKSEVLFNKKQEENSKVVNEINDKLKKMIELNQQNEHIVVNITSNALNDKNVEFKIINNNQIISKKDMKFIVDNNINNLEDKDDIKNIINSIEKNINNIDGKVENIIVNDNNSETDNNNDTDKQKSYKNVSKQINDTRPENPLPSTKSTNPTFDKLENYDLFLEFLALPKALPYLSSHFSQFTDPYSNFNIDSNTLTDYDGISDQVLPLLNKLFSRFGLSFEILSETLNINLSSYEVTITPAPDKSILDEALPLFFIEFWIYPKSLFSQYNIIKKFIIGENLTFRTPSYSQYRQACPEWSNKKSMLYTYKTGDSLSYIIKVCHHELFHYFDFIFGGCSSVVSKAEVNDWSKLNIAGFTYGSGGAYERTYVELEEEGKGFLNHYSMSGVEEDRAEIFTHLMLLDSETMENTKDKIIKEKLNYMKNFMEKLDKGKTINESYFQAVMDYRNNVKLE